jgi:hypothetical protein
MVLLLCLDYKTIVIILEVALDNSRVALGRLCVVVAQCEERFSR